MRRTILGLFAACCVLMAAACAAPPSSAAPDPSPPGDSQAASPAKPPPKSGPLPAERAVAGAIDRRCSTDADCVVKDVRNCCGMMPACVNVDSPTDPAGVAAQCKKGGMMSVCGFKAVQGCKCSRGQCTALSAAVDPIVDPAPAPPAQE